MSTVNQPKPKAKTSPQCMSGNQRPKKQRKNKPGGDHTMSAPVATNRAMQSSRMQSVYRHTERIGVVATPADANFNLLGSYAINPGLKDTFPWLSGHAALFEKYLLRRLTFRFKNLLSTTTNGNVILAFSYDTLDEAPLSAINATQKAVYVDGAPWRETVLTVPVRSKELFIRVGDVNPHADLKTYDVGRLFVCCEAISGISVSGIGYLEVSYDFVLKDKSEKLVAYTPLLAGATVLEYGAVPVCGTGHPFIYILSAGNFSIPPLGVIRKSSSNPAYFSALRAGSYTFALQGKFECSLAGYTGGPFDQCQITSPDFSLLSIVNYGLSIFQLSSLPTTSPTQLTFNLTITVDVIQAVDFAINFSYSTTPSFQPTEEWLGSEVQLYTSYSEPPPN